jgi:GT2 family glycosyltransferase
VLEKQNRDIHALVPNGALQPCDFFNGNVVLIPRAIREAIGGLDPFFHHGLGDFDYGLRARKYGIVSLIAPQSIAYCEKGQILQQWKDPAIPFRKRLKSFWAPTGPDVWRCCVFEARHRGLVLALYHLASIHWTLLAPPSREENP